MSDNHHRTYMLNAYPGFVASVSFQSLDPLRVPERLREYVPFAELWGIADDLGREMLVERAPQAAKEDLVALVERIDDELDEWLAGPEADSCTPSSEYLAFSAMRMAADYI